MLAWGSIMLNHYHYAGHGQLSETNKGMGLEDIHGTSLGERERLAECSGLLSLIPFLFSSYV